MPIHINNDPRKITNANPKKLLFFLLKCIIMACVLSLFLLFLGFAAIVLLHFLFITTAFRNRSPSTTTTTTITAATTMRVLQDCLPPVIYTASASASTSKDCAICLDCFKEGELCRSLPACGHWFHMICVDSWLTKVPNCPICRTTVQLGSQLSGPKMGDDDWKIWWVVGG